MSPVSFSCALVSKFSEGRAQCSWMNAQPGTRVLRKAWGVLNHLAHFHRKWEMEWLRMRERASTIVRMLEKAQSQKKRGKKMRLNTPTWKGVEDGKQEKRMRERLVIQLLGRPFQSPSDLYSIFNQGSRFSLNLWERQWVKWWKKSVKVTLDACVFLSVIAGAYVDPGGWVLDGEWWTWPPGHCKGEWSSCKPDALWWNVDSSFSKSLLPK